MSRMSRMSREEFERQAVLYAMGALSPEEARHFEMERARRGAEGESLDQGLRQAIGPRGVTPVERMALAAVTTEYKRRTPWAWIVLSAVCLAAGGGAVFWGLRERARAETLATQVAELGVRADSLDQELLRMQFDVEGRPRVEELVPIFVADNMEFLQLAGPTGNRGRLVYVPGGGAMFIAAGVEPLAEGATYQLWRSTAGVPQPVAPLGDARRGFLFSLLSDTAFLNGADAVMVTAETSTGAVLPSDAVLLEGRP